MRQRWQDELEALLEEGEWERKNISEYSNISRYFDFISTSGITENMNKVWCVREKLCDVMGSHSLIHSSIQIRKKGNVELKD